MRYSGGCLMSDETKIVDKAAMPRRPRNTDKHKWCPKCTRFLLRAEFSSTSGYCRPCSRDYMLEYRYGVSRDEWHEKIAGGCSLCGSFEDCRMDHDHETGGFRGVLCHRCNIGVGVFHDDPQLLRKAAEYLEVYL